MAIGVVQTRYGKVKGTELEGKYKGISIFKGIPYAAPPVGPLRWKPPLEPEKWDGIKDCCQYAPAPIQIIKDSNIVASVLSAEEYYYEGEPEMSEDCLYLNVCTGAESPKEKRPVFIWFHGGGLTNGFSYEPEFDPSEFAKKGIVVVTVGHRLGIFGYMALPQLTEEQGSSGNYGVMDQFAALDWVYENIEVFGGDRENITVGGQSSGCHKSFIMASSPEAKGRIKRIVGQSGLSWLKEFPSVEFMEEKSKKYLSLIGIDPDTDIEKLRSMSAAELYKYTPRGVMPGDMCCDGKYIKYPTLREAFEKHLKDVDILCGSNGGEAMVFEEKNWKDSGERLDTAEKFYKYYRHILGDLYDKYDFDSLVKTDDDTAWKTARHLAALGLSENVGSNMSRNLMLNRIFGMMMSKKSPGNKMFAYLFSQVEPVRQEDYGTDRDPEKLLAWHSSEMWYTFNSMREGVPPTRPWREKDYTMAEMMNSYWANFIKTGDPNGEGLPQWPATGENYGCIEFDGGAKAWTGAEDGLDGLIYEFVRREYNV